MSTPLIFCLDLFCKARARIAHPVFREALCEFNFLIFFIMSALNMVLQKLSGVAYLLSIFFTYFLQGAGQASHRLRQYKRKLRQQNFPRRNRRQTLHYILAHKF